MYVSNWLLKYILTHIEKIKYKVELHKNDYKYKFKIL